MHFILTTREKEKENEITHNPMERQAANSSILNPPQVCLGLLKWASIAAAAL